MIKILIIALTFSLTTLYAVNENSHDHKNHDSCNEHKTIKNEIAKEQIIEIAKEEVLRLILDRRIHRTWRDAKVSKIGKTHYGDTDDWKVGFLNPRIKNKKRQTLYVFVSVRGDIRGANYTGN